MTAWLIALVIGAVGWWINGRLAHAAYSDSRAISLAIPVIFGITIIAMWQVLVTMLDVSAVILPAPSAIASRFVDSIPILFADFVQTIMKGALVGFVIGMLAAFAVAVFADRSPFLTRGILPVGSPSS